MAIDCRSTLERLAEPGGLADRDASAHLSQCAGCRGAHRALALVQASREEPCVEAMSGFAVRVRAAHLQREERTRRKAPLRAALLAGALAAAGAASVGVVLDLSFPPSDPHDGTAAQAAGSIGPEATVAPFDLLPDDTALEELASAADPSSNALVEDETFPSSLED